MVGTSRSNQVRPPLGCPETLNRANREPKSGISTFGNNPSALPDYLSPLLSFAASLIPPSQHSTTPIYVLATAGMRLLSPSEQSAIVQETCSILRKSTKFALKDRCEGENVKVITGEEEGLFGWIAVNYLMDGFDNHSASTSVGAPGGGDGSTYGFLDMGGASTQIAFEPSLEERVKHADNLFKVKLGLLSGKLVSHPVFVTTWLGFGTNKARERCMFPFPPLSRPFSLTSLTSPP